jgi:hypothetical protein
MGQQVRTVEGIVGAIAARQNGVVTRAQLLAEGVTTKQITRRVRAGALIRVHRGVYRVGHTAPSVEAYYMAAVLACGLDAILSGRAAAHLWALLRSRRPPPPEVTAPTERRAAGVRTKHSRGMGSWARAERLGIPITTVPRTLVDVAAELSEEELARACHEAGVRHKTTPRQVHAVMAAVPNCPGAPRLRRILSGEVHVTLSKLERAFLALLRKYGLPLPVTNRQVGGRRVDCHWPEYGVTVELDGYVFHNSRHAWEQDREREREARARGDEFRRFTYRDVEEERYLVSEMKKLLRPA